MLGGFKAAWTVGFFYSSGRRRRSEYSPSGDAQQYRITLIAGTDSVAIRTQRPVKAVIVSEEQLCGDWNIHVAEYKTELRV